jgi:PT repeat
VPTEEPTEEPTAEPTGMPTVEHDDDDVPRAGWEPSAEPAPDPVRERTR